MAGFTNRGKYLIQRGYFANQEMPTNFFVALVTSATAPTPETNTLSDLTEIAAGNGYTANGFSLSRNTTDFDSIVEHDSATDASYAQIKDVAWTASGGSIPASGGGARYAVFTNDDASGTADVIAYWDLTSDRTVSDTQTLTLQDLQLNFTET